MRVTFPDAGVLRPRFRLTPWDLVVVPLVIVAILLLTVAFQGASQPFDETTPDLIVSLNPANLPYYGLRTVFRMFLAVLLSVLFTFTVATWQPSRGALRSLSFQRWISSSHCRSWGS
jgi:hypothetical protein